MVSARDTTLCIQVVEGPNLYDDGLKMGSKHLFEHPKWFKITFGKTRFCPSFDPFLVPKGCNFKAFWEFPWAKTCHYGLKNGLKTLV